MGLFSQDEKIGGWDGEAARTWRKSSRSYSAGGCVEVACGPGEPMRVRDSKNPRGLVLRFTPAQWRAFVDGVREGEFDPPQ